MLCDNHDIKKAIYGHHNAVVSEVYNLNGASHDSQVAHAGDYAHHQTSPSVTAKKAHSTEKQLEPE